MSYLAKQGVCDITMCTPDMKVSWPLLVQHDILLILRPAWPSYVYLCQRARDLGVKVWIDHDDNLLGLPYSHPEWSYFSSDQTREAVRDCLKAAHVITVTTENLKKVFARFQNVTENIQVIPNAIDDYLFPTPTPPKDIPNKIIAWRGGNSHGADLALLKDSVPELIKDGFRFVFFGMKPTPLESVLPFGTWTHVQWNGEVDTFLRKLSALNAPIHVVPLEDNDLNKSKSNIAWLEASWHGGSVAAVSDVKSGEWDGAFLITEPTFNSQIKGIFDASNRKEMVQVAQESIRHYYLLSSVNKKRIQIIQELMGNGKHEQST